MPAFHDVRLPDFIARGAKGGPRFSTTIISTPGGHEKRNVRWSKSRGEWDIGYGIMDKTTYTQVLEFFYARYGMAYGFRFKDFTDYEIAVQQTIGTGDAAQTDFQIYKRYTSGSEFFDRNITRPVSGTGKVYLDSIEQGSGFTIDYDTGIVSFTAAPGAGVDVAVTCEFDIPVRFNTDALDMDIEFFDAATVPTIPIVELRDG